MIVYYECYSHAALCVQVQAHKVSPTPTTSLLTQLRDLIMSYRKALIPPIFNRVDVDPQLLEYRRTTTGPKPDPQQTIFLPMRTHIAATILSETYGAQTHAYYEEIDSIPTASVDKKSEFSAGHLYVIHPLSTLALFSLSTRMLLVCRNGSKLRVPANCL